MRRSERFSEAVTRKAGSTRAFGAAAGVIVVWAALGPVFGFSDTWQLVINTGTTIVTFLMVFLIQRTQNKDALAIHMKLNELVAAIEGRQQPRSSTSRRSRKRICRRSSGTTASWRGSRAQEADLDRIAFGRGRTDRATPPNGRS